VDAEALGAEAQTVPPNVAPFWCEILLVN
jgi:hypothetical protein